MVCKKVAGIMGIEQQKLSMCEMTSMRSATSTLCSYDVIELSMTEVCQA